MPPLKAVMCIRKLKASGEDASAAAPAVPRIQNPAASKMLSLVDSLEEELFAAEARRHDTEVGLLWTVKASPRCPVQIRQPCLSYSRWLSLTFSQQWNVGVSAPWAVV